MAPRRPRDIGTADNSAVVRALQRLGFPHAEKRDLHGRYDQGDVTGIPGIMVEVKGGKAGRLASDEKIAAWMAKEVVPQIRHAGADHGFLVTPRNGIGVANAHRWWSHWYLDEIARIVTDTLPIIPEDRSGPIVRLPLADTADLLRRAGYGHPWEPSSEHRLDRRMMGGTAR